MMIDAFKNLDTQQYEAVTSSARQMPVLADLFTGGHNFHRWHEITNPEPMEKEVQAMLKTMELNNN